MVSPTVKELFPQVSYTSMEGTIWSGRINNLSFADEYLGSLNTSFNLRNLSFLVDERGLFLEGNINLISTILIRIVDIRFIFPSKKRPLSSTKKDKFLKLKLVFKLPRYSSAKDRLLILPDQMVPSILV